jgi:ferredoxin
MLLDKFWDKNDPNFDERKKWKKYLKIYPLIPLIFRWYWDQIRNKTAKDVGEKKAWEKYLSTYSLIPLVYRISHIPILGKMFTKGNCIGDDEARSWLLPINKPLHQPTKAFLPLEILKTLCEKACYRFLFHQCACRVAFHCESYSHNIGCIMIGNSAHCFPQSFGKEVGPEECIAHAEKAIQAGLRPTIIWNNDFEFLGGKKENGLEICFCCDCHCDIFLGVMLGIPSLRKKYVRLPGVSLGISNQCNLCGRCVEQGVCKTQAISLGTSKAVIDQQKCIGCGRCMLSCPLQAISYEIDPAVDIVPLLLKEIEKRTNISSIP